MKNRIIIVSSIFIIILGCLFFVLKNSELIIKSDLIIRCETNDQVIMPILAHGYGYDYNCKVVEVIKGNFDQKSLSVTIAVTDLSVDLGDLDDFDVIMKFTKSEFMNMHASGFTDENDTEWSLISIYSVKE